MTTPEAVSTKRPTNYLVEHVHRIIAAKIIPLIAKTSLTPNSITYLNVLHSFVLYWCLWHKIYIAVAILIQLYYFFDVLDGQLARYKNMTSSLGKYLDIVGDIIFYVSFYVILALKMGNSMYCIILYLVAYHLYGVITTFYIVPAIRNFKTFERRGIKKQFLDKGILFGMDNSTQNTVVTFLILTPIANLILYIISSMYLIDLIYRLTELSWNKRIASV